MKEARFRTPLAAAVGALVVQFLLGMTVNLFVKIPTDHPGANQPEFSGGVVFNRGNLLNSMLMAGIATLEREL